MDGKLRHHQLVALHHRQRVGERQMIEPQRISHHLEVGIQPVRTRNSSASVLPVPSADSVSSAAAC